MPISVGDLTPSGFFLGDLAVSKLCLGDVQVYPSTAVLAFDFASPGGSNSSNAFSTTATWLHTATAGATVLVDVSYNASTVSTITGLNRLASYGGVAMTSLGFRALSNNGSSPYVETFILANVAGGVQTVQVSAGASSTVTRRIVGASTSYVGVASFGAEQVTSNTISVSGMSHVVTSAAGQLIHQVFCAVGSIATYNQTDRGQVTLASAPTLQVGDAPGAASVTFSATRSTNGAWASIAVPLLGS